MAQSPEAHAPWPGLRPNARKMQQASVLFPLTPALSLEERENRIPSRDESNPFSFTPARATRLPLLGERAGVRGNGSYRNPKCRKFPGTVKHYKSSGRTGEFPLG